MDIYQNQRSEIAGNVNPGKQELIQAGGKLWRRIPIRTHVLTGMDDLKAVVTAYVLPRMQAGDVLFLSEKAVACTQHRAIPLEEIHPGKLARFLCIFVTKTPYGIGLGIPETMEMAIQECGVARILLAAAIAAIGKLFGQRGWFYHIAGPRAASIDGPCAYTLPPYHRYVVLGPLHPDETAADLARAIGHDVVIVDINDLGAAILGTSRPELDRQLLCQILKDNPLGQGREQTPMGVIREC